MRLSWSWRLGRLAGIPVRVHWSCVLLLLWVVLRTRSAGPGWGLAAVFDLLVVLAVFACVTLHELGHSLAARRYGIAVRDITLWPIGGVARLELGTGPMRPLDELRVALAGPAVNVALALLLLPCVWLVSGATTAGSAGLLRDAGGLSPAGFLISVWLSNVVLALFNLLPIFPLDGGRVVRALLALGGDYGRATWLAVLLAHGLAIGLVGLGLWTANLLPIGLSLVLVVGAGRELVQVRRLERLRAAGVGTGTRPAGQPPGERPEPMDGPRRT